MLHFAALALLLFPAAATSQDAGRRQVVELPAEPVHGRLVDHLTGKPVVGYRFDLGLGDRHEVCETDQGGRFRTEAGFAAGTLELRHCEGLRPWQSASAGRAREVEWDGVGPIEVFVQAGECFDLDVQAGKDWPAAAQEVGGWSVRLATEAQLESPWQIGGPHAVVREPFEPGGAHWVRFGSFLDPKWRRGSGRKHLFGERTELVVLSGNGLWYGHATFDLEAGVGPVTFEPRAALELRVREQTPPLEEDACGEEMRVMLGLEGWSRLTLEDLRWLFPKVAACPFGNTELRLTRLSAATGTEPLTWGVMPVGEGRLIGALEPGSWRIEAYSEAFATASVEVQLVAGGSGFAELVLGPRKALGDIRVVVRDHDGDLLNEDGAPVDRGSFLGLDRLSMTSQEPRVDVSIEQLDGPFRGSARSRSLCGKGVDVWCERTGEPGATFRQAVFPALLEGDYRVTVSATGRRISPASRIVHIGETVTFTLELPDAGPGYYLRLLSPEGSLVSRGATLRLVSSPGGTWRDFLEGGLTTGEANEIFLGKELPVGLPRASEWWLKMWAGRRIYGDFQGFTHVGDRFIKEIEVPSEYTARIVCRDEFGMRLAGVRVTLDGKQYVTDESGRALVKSPVRLIEDGLAFRGYERVDALHDLDLFSAPGPNFEIVLRPGG